MATFSVDARFLDLIGSTPFCVRLPLLMVRDQEDRLQVARHIGFPLCEVGVSHADGIEMLEPLGASLHYDLRLAFS